MDTGVGYNIRCEQSEEFLIVSRPLAFGPLAKVLYFIIYIMYMYIRLKNCGGGNIIYIIYLYVCDIIIYSSS